MPRCGAGAKRSKGTGRTWNRFSRFISAATARRRAERKAPERAPSSVLFFGSGGARFVVARQLRASGGMWIDSGDTQIDVDPGPGALVRALTNVPPCNPRELDAIVLSHKHSGSLERRQRHGRGDDLGRIPPARHAAGARRRLRSEPVVLPYARRFAETAGTARPSEPVRFASAVSTYARRARTFTPCRPTACISITTGCASRICHADVLRGVGRRLRGAATERADHQRRCAFATAMTVDHFTWDERLSRRRRGAPAGRRVPSTSAPRCSKPIPQRLAQSLEDRTRVCARSPRTTASRSTSTPRSRRLPFEHRSGSSDATFRRSTVPSSAKRCGRSTISRSCGTNRLHDFAVDDGDAIVAAARFASRLRSRTSNASSSTANAAATESAGASRRSRRRRELLQLPQNERVSFRMVAAPSASSKPAATARKPFCRNTRSNSTRRDAQVLVVVRTGVVGDDGRRRRHRPVRRSTGDCGG